MNNELITQKLNKALQRHQNAHDVFSFQTAKTIALMEGKELKTYVSIEKETPSSLTVLVEYQTEGIPQGCELTIDQCELMDWMTDRTNDVALTLEIMHNPLELLVKQAYVNDFINEIY